MWESPSYIGSFATAKINKEINAESRALQERLKMEELRAERDIAKYKADIDYTISSERNTVNEKINEANRLSNEAIARANRESEERIALMRTVGDVAPKVLPLVVGAQVLDKHSDGNSNSKGSSAPQQVPATGAQMTSKSQTAKEEADNLFPKLERTFKDRVNEAFSTNGATKFNLSSAMAGATISLLTAMPAFI